MCANRLAVHNFIAAATPPNPTHLAQSEGQTSQPRRRCNTRHGALQADRALGATRHTLQAGDQIGGAAIGLANLRRGGVSQFGSKAGRKANLRCRQ